MVEQKKKHGIKFLVFAINILVTAITVFFIRKQDEPRLWENAKDNDATNDNTASFESSVNLEEQKETIIQEYIAPQEENSIKDQPAASENVIPPKTVPSISTPAAKPVPSPKKSTKPDRKTKTS